MREFETVEQKSRAEVATYLRELADKLDGDGTVTIEFGTQRVDLNPADPITFEIETESEMDDVGTGATQSLELNITWTQDAQTAEGEAANTESQGQ